LLTTVPEARHGNLYGRGASAPDAPAVEKGRRTLSCEAGYPNSHLCSKINIISKLSSQNCSKSWSLRARPARPGQGEDKRKGFRGTSKIHLRLVAPAFLPV
jgi:hypothetical protein